MRLFLLSSTLVTFVAIGFMWFSVASEGMLSMIRDLPEYVMSGRGPWGHSTAVRGVSLGASKPATHGRFKTSRGVNVQ